MRVTISPEPQSQLSISTRCRTLEEFIASFRRYVDGNSIFVASLVATPDVGQERPFAFTLKDGTTAMRGRGFVKRAWETADNPYRIPGLLLGFRALTPRSIEVLQRLRGEDNPALIHSVKPAPEPLALDPPTLRGLPAPPLPARTRAATLPPLVPPKSPRPRTITIQIPPLGAAPETTVAARPHLTLAPPEPAQPSMPPELPAKSDSPVAPPASELPAPELPVVATKLPMRPSTESRRPTAVVAATRSGLLRHGKTGLWCAVALVVVGGGLLGFRAHAGRGAAHVSARTEAIHPVTTRATIQIGGTTYLIDVVLTPALTKRTMP